MEDAIRKRLEAARNLWVSTVRADGRPHLTPVWFVLSGGDLMICIQARSVKGRNLQDNSRIACALEDGSSPVIAEGRAMVEARPWPGAVRQAFQEKYEWDIAADVQYDLLLRIVVDKWLHWSG